MNTKTVETERLVVMLVAYGVSERRTAEILGIARNTVAAILARSAKRKPPDGVQTCCCTATAALARLEYLALMADSRA